MKTRNDLENLALAAEKKGAPRKAGMPPGTLIHIGKKRTKDVKVSVIDYGKKWHKSHSVADVSDIIRLKRKPVVRWINVEGLHQIELLSALGDIFKIHPLVLEDILHTGQRPKIESHEGYCFLVLRMLRYDSANKAIEDEQVSIVFGKNFVLTFQEGLPGDVFDPIRRRIGNSGGYIRSTGPDYLVYALMDAIVDEYFVILEELGEQIEDGEEELLTDATSEGLTKIHKLKRELMVLRKALYPLREVIVYLERGERALIKQGSLIYLRDLHDHIVRSIETVEIFRETLSSMIEMAMTTMSNKMNEIMKTLTVIATIFIPLTFVAGVYGMNFDPGVSPWNMPELRWFFGYPAVLSIMAALAGGMLVYFRKKHWF